MALKELTLFGEVDRIKIAINRIKRYEPPEGYYLAFSGGKDSVVIYELTKMSGVKFDAHYNNTTIDPPELVHFIRKFYPDVQEHRPKYSFLKLIVKKGVPRRQSRFCCELLKEYGGIGRTVLTGIRWQESAKRKNRKLYEISIRNKKKIFLHPIIDWDTSEIWDFIHRYNVPYCSLYDNGFSRIGCILCPMQSFHIKEREMELYPKQTMNIKKAINRLYENRKGMPSVRHWNSGDEMFNWWISGKRFQENDNDLFATN